MSDAPCPQPPIQTTLGAGRDARPNALHVSLGQLLGWMAGTCAALALMKPAPIPALESMATVPAESTLFAQGVIAVAAAPMYGIALFKLGASFWHWLIGRPPEQREPGHWLLMMIGTAFITLALVRTGFAFQQPAAALPAMLTFFLTCVFMLQSHYEVQEPVHWKFVFQYMPWFVVVAVVGCCSVPPILSFGVIVAFLASNLYAAANDVRRSETRDLLHWLGIVVVFGVVIHLAALVWFVLPH